MSFSGEVKEELVRLLPEARHCGIAELAAILEYTKAVKCDEKGAKYIEIQEETPYVARKGFTLLKKTFNIEGKMDNFVNLFRYTEEDVVQRILHPVAYGVAAEVHTLSTLKSSPSSPKKPIAS